MHIDLFLEPKPGIPPTPLHLVEVITRMQADHINTILVEPYQNRKTAETVAAKTDASVLDVSQFPGSIKGTDDDYIANMDYLVRSVAQALGKANPS